MTNQTAGEDPWRLDERVPLAEGREAEVFLLPTGHVLKLMRSPDDAPRAEIEATACRSLRAAGVPATNVFAVVDIDGRPGLVMERIDGTDLLTTLQRRPWTILRAGRVLGEVHAGLHVRPAPSALPDVREGLERSIRLAAPLPEHLRQIGLQILAAQPDGDRLCHGDLHLANVLGTFGAPVVIDWGYASRGSGASDVARTLLLHSVGQPPTGLPRVLRAVERWGRRMIVRPYLATYRRTHAVDDAELVRWRFVHAAARMNEPIPIEHPILIDLLEREARAIVS